MTTATETARSTETWVYYALAWAPDTRRQFAKQTIRPEKLDAQYVNGRLARLVLSGPAVLKNGSVSIMVHRDRYSVQYGRKDRPDLAWMWELVPATLDDELHGQILETIEVLSDSEAMAAIEDAQQEFETREEWAWTYVIVPGTGRPQPWNHCHSREAAENAMVDHSFHHPSDRLLLGRRTIRESEWEVANNG